MRWIAYQSDDSGRPEIYVQPFPDPGSRHLISTRGGKAPVCSPDGRELFYREGSAVMAVAIEIGDSFRAGVPVRLFDGPYVADNAGHASYDVSPDGERFLMIRNDTGGHSELRVGAGLRRGAEGENSRPLTFQKVAGVSLAATPESDSHRRPSRPIGLFHPKMLGPDLLHHRELLGQS